MNYNVNNLNLKDLNKTTNIKATDIKKSDISNIRKFELVNNSGFNVFSKFSNNNMEELDLSLNKKNNLSPNNNTNQTTTELKTVPTNSEEFRNLKDGEYLTVKGYTLEIKDGVAYIEDNLIVNKTYSLPNTYKPINPTKTIPEKKDIGCLEQEVMTAYKEMDKAAELVGLNIYLASSYRSYLYQDELYNRYSAANGKEEADTFSARAGHSEHQTGLAFDLNSVDESFADTAEGKWINNNAHLYGFVIRYPKGKENITGYKYEPWHLRYVGKGLAEILYNNGNWLSLEEYYGINSCY